MNNIRKLLHIDEIYNSGYNGGESCVAIIDSGIYPHDDIKNRIVDFKDFTNYRIGAYDDNGHGTHVAGIIAGDGRNSNGFYRGIAPRCNLVALKTLNNCGGGKLEDTLRAFDYIKRNMYKYKIRIINISIGSSDSISRNDAGILIDAVEDLWARGFIVVVAAGNNGPDQSSITLPGCAKSVITVGCCDDNKVMTIGNNKRLVHYSGRGPTESCVLKPEIVCYGSGIVSLKNKKNMYTVKSGTSMSTSIVSGIIALMCQKNKNITNKETKKRLHDTAIDLGLPKNAQGWGLINPKQILL